MPPYVVKDKCKGCGRCEQICIGDLMTEDSKTKKAFCRSLRDCWDCMACTKECPEKAIEQRLPYQLGYLGAKLVPEMGENTITWTCTDINGVKEVFHFKTRTKQ